MKRMWLIIGIIGVAVVALVVGRPLLGGRDDAPLAASLEALPPAGSAEGFARATEPGAVELDVYKRQAATCSTPACGTSNWRSIAPPAAPTCSSPTVRRRGGRGGLAWCWGCSAILQNRPIREP